MLIAMLLDGTPRNGVERGQVLAKPGTIEAHSRFEAQIYLIPHNEGGRLSPIFQGWKAQFYFRTLDITGTCELSPSTPMVEPGEHVTITVALLAPIAMQPELRFAIREGGRTVGAGVVTRLLS